MASSEFELSPLPEFDFDPRTRVVYGPGTIRKLGGLARELGGRRILLVTDPGLKAAGHESAVVGLLQSADLNVSLFDDVHENPTTDDVDRGTAYARDEKIDLIIGLGGGSSMDCAKGINFLVTNGGRVEDYRGAGRAAHPLLPMIAAPTTAGTGSEAQSFAIISRADTHEKMACGDKQAAPRIAVLDPELTQTMPASVTAISGIDAISHAVESYVTSKRNPVSQMFSRRAWRMLSRAFPAVLRDPEDLTARGGMLLGAHLAGAAIENSMLGATHALANPVSAHFGVTHGVAIGVLLPHVVRYNSVVVDSLYGNFASDAGVRVNGSSAGFGLAEKLTQFVHLAGNPLSLEECGVDEGAFAMMAREAADQWTGKCNPRPLQMFDFEELYRCAFRRI